MKFRILKQRYFMKVFHVSWNAPEMVFYEMLWKKYFSVSLPTIVKSKLAKVYSKWETQIIFNWYLTNVTLNKYLLVGTWHVILYHNTFKSAITFYLIKHRVLAKKRKQESSTQNGIKVWKILDLWICQVDLVTLLTNGIVALSLTRERLPGSTLSICLKATKYFYH